MVAVGLAVMVGGSVAGGAAAQPRRQVVVSTDAPQLGATVCGTLGITPAVVAKIFGAGATIRKKGVPRSSPCTLRSGHLVTTILLGPEPASMFAHTLKYDISYLSGYAPAHKTSVPGAGGAVLCTTTNYDSILAPFVLFKAVGEVGVISTTAGGVGQSPAAYAEWEALARAIHAHVG